MGMFYRGPLFMGSRGDPFFSYNLGKGGDPFFDLRGILGGTHFFRYAPGGGDPVFHWDRWDPF